MKEITNIESWMRAFEPFINLSVTYIIKISFSLLVLIVGFMLVGRFMDLLRAKLSQALPDATLRAFSLNVISSILKVLLFITVLSMLGVQVTAILTALGAAGLAVGLALQGSLKNLAGGLLLLMFRPVQIGDKVSISGYDGHVVNIQTLYTMIETFDGRIVTIPNEVVMNTPIINYFKTERSRVSFTIGISYKDNIEKAKQIALDECVACASVLSDPAPKVGVLDLADSSVNLFVHAWSENADYWKTCYTLKQTIKESFDKHGISIPFPQRDLNITQMPLQLSKHLTEKS